MNAVLREPTPKELLAEGLAEAARRKRTRKFSTYYPETGPFRRSLYPKHMRFLAAGLSEKVRAAIAANRTGKTEGMGGYELVCHLTGKYPDWWAGKRFTRGVKAWACGNTGKTVREILQTKLLGDLAQIGTGLIPGDLIVDSPRKPGVPDAIDLAKVRHASGDISQVTFKSYDQGREAFEGTEIDFILLDEEPPIEIFTECLLRTMATGAFAGGIIVITFTPLKGLTPLIKHLRESKAWEIGVTWADVPHLTEADKKEILANVPEHQRDARSKGIPITGYGLIFDVPEIEIKVQPFEIPGHWPWIGAIDFGQNHPTAGGKLAFDRDNKVTYVTAVKKAIRTIPDHFALSLKAWGTEWLPFAWPHDGHQSGEKFNRADNLQLHEIYKAAGLKMLADPAQFSNGSISVEAGLLEMLGHMRNGQWKVFANCEEWFEEYRGYQRDEHGQVIKDKDDAISATRYGYMMRRFAKVRPVKNASRNTPSPSIGHAKVGY